MCLESFRINDRLLRLVETPNLLIMRTNCMCKVEGFISKDQVRRLELEIVMDPQWERFVPNPEFPDRPVLKMG